MNKQELEEMYEAALVNAGQEYGFSTTNLQVAEKFAELIVEKCIDIVSAGGEFASRPKLVEQIEKYFDVK